MIKLFETRHLINLVFLICIFFLPGCNKDQKESLGVRNAHVLFYDEDAAKIYLFGGADERQVRGDTWSLEKDGWHQVSGISPAPRTFPVAIWDPSNKQTLLFGGSKVLFGKAPDVNNLLNDTWIFKNDKWQLIKTAQSPPPRCEAQLSYDPATKSVILFGGYTIVKGDYVALDDTWVFNSGNWSLLKEVEKPTACYGCLFLYDSLKNAHFLPGGKNGNSGKIVYSWKLEKLQWVKQSNPDTNIIIKNAAFAKGKTDWYKYGGWDTKNKERIDQTYKLQNDNWVLVKIETKPSPRNHTSMAFDKKTKRFVLYGGHDGENVFGDTWILENDKWAMLFATKPITRIENDH